MEKHPGKRHVRALISVYNKQAVQPLAEQLHALGVALVSTGGSMEFLKEKGLPVRSVEELTGFPSFLGGRVKTLHPAVFGAILCRPDLETDKRDMEHHGLLAFDMVVTDLYPFEATLASGAPHDEIMEKIDIGGVSLIRAAAKNFQHVLVIPSAAYFDEMANLLKQQGGISYLSDRRSMAAIALHTTSHYDTAIFHYLNEGDVQVFKESIEEAHVLRYGENPHQQGCFYGKLNDVFEQLSGKPLSYNNLLDIDAAMALMAEFSAPSFAIIKHTNACGVASRETIEDAWEEARSGDPASAFGGILIANRNISEELARAINDIFYEVILAPSYDDKSLEVLRSRKNRIILKTKSFLMPEVRYRTVMNGVLWQTSDYKSSIPEQWRVSGDHKPNADEEKDLVFANSIVKHLKSNAIALVKDMKLLGAGMGQTSRVDAVKQAIAKARLWEHDLDGAVLASDAFFPFPDSVEMAQEAGIRSVIQPGGSKNDMASIDFCNKAGMSMVFTSNRHFRH